MWESHQGSDGGRGEVGWKKRQSSSRHADTGSSLVGLSQGLGPMAFSLSF
jgi:hypothetical protein